MSLKPIPVAVTLAVGLILWFMPFPQGVDVRAWHLLAIFVATLVGIIVKVLPMGAVAMIGIAVTALTGVLKPQEALSGFANTTIWLIVVAFFVSRGFIKTGLGSRIAYFFVKVLGRRTLGLGYGLVAADFVLAPAMPSNTARAGGVIFPVARSLAMAYGSDPDTGTARKIGAYLTFTAFQGTVITGAMFLTGMAANPLAQKFAANMRINFSWGDWAIAAAVPGIVSLLVIPWLIYKLFPPEIKSTPEAVEMAKDALAKLGPIKRSEWLMLGTFILLLLLWIFGPNLMGMDATTAALVGLAVLIVTNVLGWEDVLAEKGAWDTLVWFAALVMMATYLNSLGLIPWFTILMGKAMQGGSLLGVSWPAVSWQVAFPILGIVYFYSHYLFASNTAHVSAMYVPFLGVLIAVGAPPLVSALVLGFYSNLFSSMTHYGTGPSPVFFGSRYVELKDWWILGFIVSVANLTIWFLLGWVWWKALGLF